MPPSVLTLAGLSQAVYTGGIGYGDYTEIARVVDPVDYGFANNGFAASAYQSNSQVVIAFRGTVSSVFTTATLKSLAEDISFGGTTPSPFLTTAVDDAADFVAKVYETIPDAHFTLTGHSLGGAIAQLLGKESGLPTVGFNAPGAAQLFGSLQNELGAVSELGGGNASPNTNFRIFGDQISLFGSPIGTSITLSPPVGTSLFREKSPALDFIENASTYLNLHSIATVISQIEVGTEGYPRTDEPNDSVALEHYATETSIINPLDGVTVESIIYTVLNGLSFLLDPNYGSDFILSRSPASTAISSIGLPALAGISSYRVKQEVGGKWSPFKTVAAGKPYKINLKAEAVEFDPYDANSRRVAITDALLFQVQFATTGVFVGSMVNNDSNIAFVIPTTKSDAYSAIENQTLQPIATDGVLANDIDNNGLILTRTCFKTYRTINSRNGNSYD
jgi:hypothetical protein